MLELAEQAAAALFLQRIHPSPHLGPHPLSHASPHLYTTNKIVLRRYSPLCLHLQLNEHQKRKKEKRERRQERRAEKKKLAEQELELALRVQSISANNQIDESAIAQEINKLQQTQQAQRMNVQTTAGTGAAVTGTTTRTRQQSLTQTLASPTFTAELMMQLQQLQQRDSEEQTDTETVTTETETETETIAIATAAAEAERAANRQTIQRLAEVEAEVERMRQIRHAITQQHLTPTAVSASTCGPSAPLLHSTAHSPSALPITSCPLPKSSMSALRLASSSSSSSSVTPAPLNPYMLSSHPHPNPHPHSPPSFRPVTSPLDLPTASPSQHQRRLLSSSFVESTSPSLTARFLLASNTTTGQTQSPRTLRIQQQPQQQQTQQLMKTQHDTSSVLQLPNIHIHMDEPQHWVDEMKCSIQDRTPDVNDDVDVDVDIDADTSQSPPLSLSEALTSPPDSNNESPTVGSEQHSPASSVTINKQSFFQTFSTHLKHQQQHQQQQQLQHQIQKQHQSHAFHMAQSPCVV